MGLHSRDEGDADFSDSERLDGDEAGASFCPPSPDFSTWGAEVDEGGSNLGDTRVVRCDEDRQFYGVSTTITCGPEALWEGVAPNCTEFDCQECAIEEQPVPCVGSPEQCSRIRCPDEPELDGKGILRSGQGQAGYGATRDVECNTCFGFVGLPLTLICDGQGRWQGPLSQCEGLGPGAPVFSYGSVDYVLDDDGWTGTVTCESDYELVGNESSEGSTRCLHGTQVWTEPGSCAGAEFQVNVFTANSQSGPRIASLSTDSFVIIWTSDGQDRGGPSLPAGYGGLGIFGRVFHSDGTPLTSEFPVNTTTSQGQFQPAISPRRGEGFMAAWLCQSGDSSGDSVDAQVFDELGATVGPEFQANTREAYDQLNPSIAHLAGKRTVIVFWDRSSLDIFGQLYDARMNEVGEEFQINTYHQTFDQQRPKAIPLAGGGFVVVWRSGDQDGSSWGVFGQVFDESGVMVGQEFQVNDYIIDEQRERDVAPLSDGGFVVVWQSLGQDGDGWGVYGQMFDDGAEREGPATRINDFAEGSQTNPVVALLDEETIFVTWTVSLAGKDGRGQLFDSEWNKIGANFRINQTRLNDQLPGSVGVMENGDFVVAWTANGDQDGDGTGVFARVFDRPEY